MTHSATTSAHGITVSLFSGDLAFDTRTYLQFIYSNARVSLRCCQTPFLTDFQKRGGSQFD